MYYHQPASTSLRFAVHYYLLSPISLGFTMLRQRVIVDLATTHLFASLVRRTIDGHFWLLVQLEVAQSVAIIPNHKSSSSLMSVTVTGTMRACELIAVR